MDISKINLYNMVELYVDNIRKSIKELRLNKWRRSLFSYLEAASVSYEMDTGENGIDTQIRTWLNPFYSTLQNS